MWSEQQLGNMDNNYKICSTNGTIVLMKWDYISEIIISLFSNKRVSANTKRDEDISSIEFFVLQN